MLIMSKRHGWRYHASIICRASATPVTNILQLRAPHSSDGITDTNLQYGWGGIRNPNTTCQLVGGRVPKLSTAPLPLGVRQIRVLSQASARDSANYLVLCSIIRIPARISTHTRHHWIRCRSRQIDDPRFAIRGYHHLCAKKSYWS